MKKWLVYGLLTITISALFVACSSSQQEPKKKTLKVAATPVPHAEMLELIKPDLKEKGIDLKIVVVEDYQLPNRLLAERQVDANFFQHEPFLKAQIEAFHYQIVSLKKIHYEPLGLYSKNCCQLEEVSKGAKIAIPNDPSNETRALIFLEKLRWISLKNSSIQATVLDIEENPHQLKILEIDAPLLPRVLCDVNFAVIPGNFALQAGLNPQEEALWLEEGSSSYANLLVVRKGDEEREDLILLSRALCSPKMTQYLEVHFRGAVKSFCD